MKGTVLSSLAGLGTSAGAIPSAKALGYSQNALTGGKALAAHWNGKAWSDQSVASPEQLNLLGGVSCPAVKDCVAVGTAGTVTSSALALAPLAEQWTGGKWGVLTVPDPAPAGDVHVRSWAAGSYVVSPAETVTTGTSG